MSYRGDAIVAGIREGLYDAVLESDDVNVTDFDSITFQKLLLKAIEAFNLEEDVTISWYLDGEVLYSREANFDRFGGGMGYRSVSSTMQELAGAPDPDRVKDFYLNRIEPSMASIVDEPTFEYLRDYYEGNAPLRYRQIYLSNLELATSLSDIEAQLGRERELAGQMEPQLVAHWEEFTEEASVLEELAPAQPYIETFGEALQQFANWYDTEFETADISRSSIGSVVGSFKVFYFEGTWRPIALIISRETAEGSRDDELKNERDAELDNHFETFISELTSLRDEISDTGIDIELVDSGSWGELTSRVREQVGESGVTEEEVGDAIEWARSQ